MIMWRIQPIDYTWCNSVSVDNSVLAGIGWMTVGSTFIVGGQQTGIGINAIGSTFIVG